MLDNLPDITNDPKALASGAVLVVLAVATVVWLAVRIVTIAKSERPDEPLSNLGMLVGFGWSSEAVWVLTGPGGAGLATPIRIALFLVLEQVLLVFMIRANRNVREIGKPGRAGRIAWGVASGMALVAVWTAHNPGEGFLRLLIPIVLTAMWWDGLVPEKAQADEDAGGRFNWTPRRLAIRVGAITPGDKDVKTVHREQLTQRMTTLYYDSLYGPEGKRDKVRSKLARLTLDADDAMIAEVARRVRRTSWTTAKPLPYDLTQDGDARPDAPGDAVSDAPATHLSDAVTHRVTLPPARRGKTVTQPLTSGDEPDADPSTRAAHLSVTQNIPLREAVRQVPGAVEATARRRAKAMTPQTQAEIDAADAVRDARGVATFHSPPPAPQTNGHPVLAGHSHTSEEN